MNKILILILLTGCSYNPIVSDKPALDQSPVSGQVLTKAVTTVNIDPYLLTSCIPLQDMHIDNPTPNNVLVAHKQDVIAYKECKEKHTKVVDILKKALNITEGQ